MKNLFFRLDEKFIHAQIIHGWLPYLNASRIIGVSEKYSGDEASKRLYLEAIPEELEGEILSPADAAIRVGENTQKGVTLVLFSSIGDACDYIEEGGKIGTLNLGGLYSGENRREYLPYIHLNTEEKECLSNMAAGETDIYCQDVPLTDRIDFLGLINK
ncbi:MAG: hypothetical protein GF307_04055 [candidate division Zixibacteria bacterium]|nr:hypothetical protein [candidate division Zixibacteria bacterium]